jgi:hypothetical protein
MNPSYSDANARVNGGLGSQGYWGNSQTSGNNIFNPNWSKNDYSQMYNMNSIAPFGGDRYTGYDALTQQFAPMGTATSVYHPAAENTNTDTGVSSSMADMNDMKYRNFYKRYFEFYNKNLDLLSAKLKQRSNPFDFSRNDLKKKLNPKSFDYVNNYFDQKPEHLTMRGANLPSMIVTGPTVSRKLSVTNEIKKIRRQLRQLKCGIDVMEKDILKPIESSNERRNIIMV